MENTIVSLKPTVIIGASANQARYSHRAQRVLLEKNIPVYPVHPSQKDILGCKVYASLQDILDQQLVVHTITVYVRPAILMQMLPELIMLQPERVIFNPGAEDFATIALLKKAGIQVQEACTLVLLSTEQY